MPFDYQNSIVDGCLCVVVFLQPKKNFPNNIKGGNIKTSPLMKAFRYTKYLYSCPISDFHKFYKFN